MGRELVQVIEGMLRRPEQVLGVVALESWSFECNAEREDGFTNLMRGIRVVAGCTN
jgi:hypothetical protein